MAISYCSHKELIQKGTALGGTWKVLWAVEEGEFGFPGRVKQRWCPSGESPLCPGERYRCPVSRKSLQKEWKERERPWKRKLAMQAQTAEWSPWNCKGWASVRESWQVSVRERGRISVEAQLYVTRSYKHRGKVTISLPEMGLFFHVHLVTGAKPQRPHPWNCLHSCPRFIAINCKIMSMSFIF